MRLTTRRASSIGLPGVALIVCALLIAGCGGGSDGGGGGTSAGASSQASTQAKPGGTLYLADRGEALTLNPQDALDNNSEHVFAQVVEPLFRTTADGKIEPWLATNLSSSSDLKTWTITLRKGVKFSNGRPMTAEDVAYSLNVIRKTEAWSGMFAPISSVTATPAGTVVIKTSKPFAAMEASLTLPFAGIVPKNLGGETEKEFNQHPIGTGPFKVVNWAHGQSITLERNPTYWRPKEPLLEKVVFESTTDDSSRLLQLRSGQLDLIASPAPAQVPSIENLPEATLGEFGLAIPNMLILNVRKPLFADHRIREAIDLAIDREAILEAANKNIGEVAGSWLAPALHYHDAGIKVTRDTKKAKKLVEEVVAETGLDPSFTLSIQTGEEFGRLAAQVLQEDLDEVGFTVTVQQLDESTLFNLLPTGKFEAAFHDTLTSDIVEPSEVVGYYIGLKSLFTGASTATMSKLLDEATGAADAKKREQFYTEIQQHVATEKEVIPLTYSPWTWAMSDHVTGFDLPPTGVPWLAPVGLSE